MAFLLDQSLHHNKLMTCLVKPRQRQKAKCKIWKYISRDFRKYISITCLESGWEIIGSFWSLPIDPWDPWDPWLTFWLFRLAPSPYFLIVLPCPSLTNWSFSTQTSSQCNLHAQQQQQHTHILHKSYSYWPIYFQKRQAGQRGSRIPFLVMQNSDQATAGGQPNHQRYGCRELPNIKYLKRSKYSIEPTFTQPARNGHHSYWST